MAKLTKEVLSVLARSAITCSPLSSAAALSTMNTSRPNRTMALHPYHVAVLLLSGASPCSAFSTNGRVETHCNQIHRGAPTRLCAERLFGILGPINEDIWDTVPPKRIEGNSLQTWAFSSGTTQRVQVSIKSVGRPIEASVELWQTPSYTPTKFTVECEDASENIVHSIIELPLGHPTTVAVYNTEGQEFPMDVSVAEMNDVEGASAAFEGQTPQYIEGRKGVKSYNFNHGVESVEVFLRTSARNMKGGYTALHFFSSVIYSQYLSLR